MQAIVNMLSEQFPNEGTPRVKGKTVMINVKEIKTKQLKSLEALTTRQIYSYTKLAEDVNIKRSGAGLLIIVEAR